VRALLAAVALLLGAPACASAAVSLAQIGSFEEPVYATGDTERVYVVEKAGRIVMLRGGARSTYLDIASRVDSTGSEEGLLSMALSGSRLFVYYTAPRAAGGSVLTISEFAATPDSANPASERVILRIEHPTFDNHNGGLVQIGPDGLLWAGTGDGGSGGDPSNNAQNPASLLGKLLRIDPNPGGGCGGGCTIPAGNPGLAAPEVWATGLRNPWRWSFDRQTGDLWIGDVGQGQWEEVDFAAAPGRGPAANYGWDAFEGAHRYTGANSGTAPRGNETAPVHEYPHTDGRQSIVGGVVVRDPALPDLFGKYLYVDTYAGPIQALTFEPSGRVVADTPTSLTVPVPVSFGEDACGRVYVVSLSGPVYRLADSGECRTPGPPGAGPPGAGAPGGAAGPDVAAPLVTLRAARRQRALRTARVRLTAACDEQCRLTARGTFLVRRARGAAAAAAVPLRTGTHRRTLAAGARVPLVFKVPRKVRRSLGRALRRGRRVTISFTVTAHDAAGNRRVAKVGARIVR
jgi:glucose/arabinose dehydrogenase